MLYFNNLVRDAKKELSRYILAHITVNHNRTIVKFIYDMVYGILSSGSSKISKIARHLYEKDIRITEHRLTKNLLELDLSSVKSNYYKYVMKELAKYAPNILVDQTDVIKPYGKAFEGLNIIHDASRRETKRKRLSSYKDCYIKRRKIISFL